MYSTASKKEFQWKTAWNSPIVAMTGIDNGMTILNRMPILEAPSILADSSSSAGTLWKKFLTMIRLNALIAVGMMYAQNVLSNPVSLTTR
ncbi:Uncharacterised protein [Mycobacteroides abscessus subsp. abscessus]|nr:Uncharacterised protein [Mycobacteroides abscessus subsp. abscessus]